jgi:hypothetical protein
MRMRRKTYYQLRDRAWQKLAARNSALDASFVRAFGQLAPDILKGLLDG